MISFRNVSGGYPRHEVLHGISLDISCGELLCIIGKNGCGKTTLIKNAAGLLKPLGGEILCGDEKLSSMKPRERAKRVAYLPQAGSPPDMTVLCAVLQGRFPHASYPARYGEADRLAALGAIERLGLSDCRDTPVCRLSGGMRQRVYIAMAICGGAEHILLDEPCAHLDIDGQIELMKLLRSLAAEGKAVAAGMHDLPLAFTYADKIALIDGGAVAAYGNPYDVSRGDALKQVFSVAVARSEDGIYRYKYTEENNG